jgi:hypothetical protein
MAHLIRENWTQIVIGLVALILIAALIFRPRYFSLSRRNDHDSSTSISFDRPSPRDKDQQ